MTNDNRQRNKKILRNTSVLYVRMIVVLLISLYTSRVVLEVLGVDDYGVYNVVGGVVAFFSFFTSSLANASQRYLNVGLGKEDAAMTARAFRQSFSIYLPLSLLMVIVAELVGVWFVENKLNIPSESRNAALWVFQFAVLSAFLSVNQVTFLSDIVAHERMSAYAYLGIFDVAAKLVVVLMLKFFPSKSVLVLYAGLMTAVVAVTTFFYVFYCYRHFPETSLRFLWDKRLVRDMGKFIGINLYGCFCWSLNVQGSVVLLNLFFGPAVNAARGVAVQVNGVVVRFAESLTTAFKPQIIQSCATSQLEYMVQLINRCSIFSFLLMLFVSVPIIANVDFILDLWLVDVPPYTAIFIVLTLIETIISSLATSLWLGANATGNIKRNQLYGRSMLLVGLAVTYLLLKFVDNPTVPFFVAICLGVLMVAYSVFDMHIQIGLKVGMYLRHVVVPLLGMSALLSVLAFAAGCFEPQGFMRFFLVLALEAVVGGPVVLRYFFDAEERSAILVRLRKLFNR